MPENNESQYKLATEGDVAIAKKGSWISLILALYVLGFLYYVAVTLLLSNPLEAVWYFPYLAAILVVIFGLFKRKKWLPRFYLFAVPISIIIDYLGVFITLGLANINWQDFVFPIIKDIIVFALLAWYFNSRPECFKN